MTDHELGPLPTPPSYESKYDDAPLADHYNAHQMRAYAIAEVARAVAAEREACAKLCEAIVDEYTRLNFRRAPGLRFEAEVGALKCESAIRARGQA